MVDLARRREGGGGGRPGGGVFVPAIGIAAAIGIALYFAGAVITVLRAKSYAHVAFPLIYAAPAVATLALAVNG